MENLMFSNRWGRDKNNFKGMMNYFSTFIIVLISLLHVLIVVSMVSENSDNSAIVFASNNDASVGITVATQTRWFNDNGWRPYGPLYYRFAHSLTRMVPYYKSREASAQDSNQVRHHFALMLISFVALLLTCFIISGSFRLSLAERIGTSSLFFSTFLLNRSFARYVLVAHPDYLLTFFTALLFVASYRFIKYPTRLGRTLVGVFFGLMLSTKVTAIFFLPGIFWVLYSKASWKESLKNWISFFPISLVSYFLVGYPQNFKIDEIVEFLIAFSRHSSIADGTSIAEWIGLFCHQLWLPLLLSLSLLIVSGRQGSPFRANGERLDRRALTRVALFAIFPIGTLMSQKFNSPHDYYTIPFGILFLLAFNVFFREVAVFGFLAKYKKVRKCIFIFLIPLFAVRSNTYFASIVREESSNRSGYRKVQSWISKKAQEGHTVLLNSYVPMPIDYDSTKIVMANKYSFEKLKGKPYSAMALNKIMYGRYIIGEKPSDYDLVDFQKEDWRPVREFYNFFKDGKDVKTPDGREWHMVSDQYGIQLWQVKQK